VREEPKLEIQATKRTKPQNKSTTCTVDYLAVVACVLAVSVVFVPFMLNIDSNITDAQLDVSYRSQEAWVFAVAGLSVCTTLTVELFLDSLAAVQDGFFLLRCTTLAIAAVYYLVLVIPSSFVNHGAVCWTVDWFQWTGEYLLALWLLHKLDSSSYWTKTRVGTLMVIYYVTYILALLQQISPDNSGFVLWHAVMSSLNISVFGCAVLYWLYSTKSTTMYYSSLSIIGCLLALQFTDALLAKSLSSSFLDARLGIRTGVMYFLCLLPVRLCRERTNALHQDSDTMNAFVKFISHELRTPINVKAIPYLTFHSVIDSILYTVGAFPRDGARSRAGVSARPS
jgi:hypothetical protein